MRFYSPEPLEGHYQVGAKDGFTLEALMSSRGKSLASVANKLKDFYIEDKKMRGKRLPADLPWGGSMLAMNARALAVLEYVVAPYGEIIPVETQKGVYYLFNCTNVINCLDHEKIVVRRFEDTGAIFDIEKYSFKINAVNNQAIFRIKETGETVYNEIVKNIIESNALIGTWFKEIWEYQEQKGSE